ncbi:disulfide isomerase [Epithele typhae]|uniref:disulfide isomerase n=1 Tax=Epithele typhae TaxID=378194 RepID=UPI002008571A|nr:disulfide isomerase [Epithele typhae]KAH9943444.1 disulfide isomerase [Epithele typhae]
MRFSHLFSTAAALAALHGALASDVLDLTASDFASVVNPEDLILVEFFAPWCGHCKALAPHYEEAATELKAKNIKLAKVNCVDEADFCQSNGIQGYPTVRVYRKGEHSEYTGPRKADGIISYMTKQSLPAVSEVNSANFQEFKGADRIVVVAFASSTEDAHAAEFSATANKHRDDYLFGLATDKSVAEAAGITPPAIVVFRSFDEPQTEYPYPIGSAKVHDIENWIQDLSIPVIDEVGADNYQAYASSGKPLAYLFLDPTDEKHDEHVNMIKPVASKYKGKLNFVWIDAVKYGDHARALNLVEPKWPSFVIQDLGKQLKYPFDQGNDVTAEAVNEMVELYLDHKLEPQLKSQPIPEVQDEPVFNLVGKQFEEVALDDSRDVFVEFYASWCGHCKRLKPTWDSLGEHFAPVRDRVTIAKMEATENDLPPSVPFRVSGFPTLKFKPAGSHEFLDYDGDRSLENLIAFVEENAKNSLEVNTSAPADSEQVVMDTHHDHHHEEL